MRPNLNDIHISPLVKSALKDEKVKRIIASQVHGSFQPLPDLTADIEQELRSKLKTSFSSIQAVIEQIASKQQRLNDRVRKWYVHENVLREMEISQDQVEYLEKAKWQRWMECKPKLPLTEITQEPRASQQTKAREDEHSIRDRRSNFDDLIRSPIDKAPEPLPSQSERKEDPTKVLFGKPSKEKQVRISQFMS